MRRLFVNADDFGLTDGVCRGILEAMATGIVGGTTAMVCATGALGRIASLGPSIAGRLGLHLQLTGGVPPCLPPAAVPSLVTAQGTFPRKKQDVTAVDPDDVRREWRAQLDTLRRAGMEPSHLDAHHHIHARPGIFPVFVELARELGLPARAVTDEMRRILAEAGVPHADACVTGFFGDDLSPGRFLDLVDAAFAALGGEGTVEVMVHPGHNDASLEAISTYAAGRPRELAVLTAPVLTVALAERGISILSAGALAAGRP